MSDLAHQDWKPIILQSSTPKPSSTATRSKDAMLDQKTEVEPIKKYTIIHRENLQNYRRTHNVSQKDVALRCQFPIHKIQDIENGGIYDSKIIQILNNKLKINLNKKDK